MVSRRLVRRAFPLALGIVAAMTILAVLLLPDRGPVEMVCNIGTDQERSAYERCIAELPARHAEFDESVLAASATSESILALAGGAIVAIAARLILGSRRPRYLPVDDEPWTFAKPRSGIR